MFDLNAFTSTQIRLAAMITDKRASLEDTNEEKNVIVLIKNKKLKFKKNSRMPLIGLSCLLAALILLASTAASYRSFQELPHLRHQAHYLNIVPSTHFQYNEGRQLTGGGQSSPPADAIQERSAREEGASHMYKRSSALISSPVAAQHYAPLVGSQAAHHTHGRHHQERDPLRRRMMSEGAHQRWTAPLMAGAGEEEQPNPSPNPSEQVNELTTTTAAQQATGASKRRQHEEAELLLLKQKQHIQYHDQWPTLAGKCHKRTLNFCASVLPFNTTTFPNIIGDTNRFEVKRSLPFFGFLAKSSCNKRLDELLCLLLEPPCAAQSGVAIPPCKKFCRLALEGCNEYIPATLAMSSVFDCRQYPDSNDPSVCINLATGSKCAADEFKCPDKTCIPRNWLCDGVRDCIFAADEANCTAITGVGLQASVCSTEEFKCDGKCVPKAWKCDGERDCLDGKDEEACDLRPRCGPDRFKCADGNGCLPKRWVCDGKAECRDGSDEMNCAQRECSENDFKCDNGICIPKLWRCDKQFDCKDGSDERSCIYPTTTSTTTPQPTETGAPERAGEPVEQPINHQNASVESSIGEDVSRIIHQQEAAAAASSTVLHSEILVAGSTSAPTPTPADARQQPGKDMKKFDYDIIQSASPPAAEQAPQQVLTQIDYVPQQQLHVDYAPSAKPAEPQEQVRVVVRSQSQEQPQRSRAFGQPPKAPEQPAFAVERVPIYRSLFKTLKGGQARVVHASANGGAAGAGHRYALVAGRRRRDRHPQQPEQTTPDAQWASTSSPLVALNPDAHTNVNATLASNQRSHSVASYLQLLNSRYNLRLSRASPMQPQPQTPVRSL